ncbi:MAG: RICIN domain-containing protein [Cellvibrionaceae bacterium]|nr:RICIN domain-containing protein [Cellvibrionaceae bacterium]
MKKITQWGLTAMLPLFFAISQAGNDAVVEIMLASDWDEPRGYCLDIAGGQGAKAPLDKGLQAHTCYHYTGGILEDQGFDAALIDQGQFRIAYFDRCMSVSSIAEGAAIALAQCDKSDTQQFTLQANGQLVTQNNPKLCVTVNSTEKKQGRGASPVHVMRPLSLQLCDNASHRYQTWAINAL